MNTQSIAESTSIPVRVIDVDESVYSRNAVLRTCYWFTDTCYLFVTRTGAEHLQVEIRLKHSKPTLAEPVVQSIDEVAGDFMNALLDYQLRLDIETETGKIRDVLMAKAFAESGLYDDTPPGDPSDSVDTANKTAGLVSLRQSQFGGK